MIHIFLLLNTTLAHLNGHKSISSINLLLPLNRDSQVSQQIEAYNGCFEWQSSHPHILQVEPIADKTNCHNRASVQVITRTPFSGIVWIQAKDKVTGEVLSCEAQVSKIKRLQILTKKKTVLVDELETLELQGFDEKGNTFSTLEGLSFSWSLKQDQNYAEFLTFKQAQRTATSLRKKLEQKNQQTDINILKGLENGKVILNVKLIDSDYQNLTTQETLHIIENFIVFPRNDLYLIRCDKIQMQLFKVKNKDNKKVLNKVFLPNEQFNWILKKNQIGKVENSGLLQIEKNPKSLFDTLEIQDVTNVENKIEKQIFIVEPVSMDLTIQEINEENSNYLEGKKYELFETLQPISNWNLLYQKKYIIKAKLLDEKGNEIEYQNFSIKFTSQENYVEVSKSNQWIIIEANEIVNNGKIRAEFKHQDCSEIFLNVTKSFSVNSQVKILRVYKEDSIYLPLLNEQKHQLISIGGSSQYSWESSDANVALVSNGLIQVVNQGKITIVCRDQKNQNNFDQITVVITDQFKVRFFEQKKETLIQKEDDVFVQGLTNDGKFLASCDQVSFSVSGDSSLNLSNKNIALSELNQKIYQKIFLNENYTKHFNSQLLDYIKENEFYLKKEILTKEELISKISKLLTFGICKDFTMKSEKEGLYEIISEKLKMQLKVFKPYQLEYPYSYDVDVYGKEVILNPGSQANFIVKDGISAWTQQGKINHTIRSDQIYKLEIEDQNDKIKIVKVECKNADNNLQKHTVYSSNNDPEIINPLILSVEIQFQCNEIESIKIYPIILQTKYPKTFLNFIRQEISLRNDEVHQLTYQAFNKQNKPFWNTESFNDKWTLSDQKFGKIANHQNGQIELEINDKIGSFKLQVTGKGQKNSNFNQKSLSDEVVVKSFQSFKVAPSSLIVINHPENLQTLKILKGSGNFNVKLTDESLASISYNTDKKLITLKPLYIGNLKIIVTDMNMAENSEQEIDVQIVQPDYLKLILDGNAFLINTLIQPIVKVYYNNHQIPDDQLKFLNIQLISNKPVDIDQQALTLKSSLKKDIELQAQILNYNLKSNIIGISIYEHIKAFPSQLVLTKDCIGHFKIHGGPDHHLFSENKFEFQILGDKLLRIENQLYNQFRVQPKINGEETLTLRLLQNGEEISRTLMSVIVDEIDGLRIKGPRFLELDATQRVLMIPQIKSFNVSPAICQFGFEFTNNTNDILESTSFKEKQIKENFTFQGYDIKALKNGKALLNFILVTDHNQFNESIEIDVYEDYQLPQSQYINQEEKYSNYLLMKPNSELQMKQGHHFTNDQKICHINNNKLICNGNTGREIVFTKHHEVVINSQAIEIQYPFSLFAQNGSKYLYINKDININLDLVYLSQEGKKFNNLINLEETEFINTNPNYVEITKDKNGLKLVTKEKGKTYLYIQDVQNSLYLDALEINVGQLISPNGFITIHVGDTIKFQSLNSTQPNWESTNNKVFRINQIGQALGENQGTAHVLISTSKFPAAEINVKKVNKLNIIENDRVITNILNHKNYQDEYSILFSMFQDDEQVKFDQTDGVTNNLQVECNTSDDYLVSSPIKDFRKGIIGCKVNIDNKKKLSDPQVTLNIKLTSSKAKFLISNSIQLTVLPKVSSENKQDQVQLSKGIPKQTLSFTTSQELLIINQDTSKLATSSKFNQKLNQQKITFQALSEDSFTTLVILRHPFSDQEIRVQVSFDQNNKWQEFKLFSFNFFDLIIVVVLSIVVFMLIKKFRNNEVEVVRKMNSTNFTNTSGIYDVSKMNQSIFSRNPQNQSINRRDIYNSKRLY